MLAISMAAMPASKPIPSQGRHQLAWPRCPTQASQ
jgi:hypothetical protein